jgi:hypothetical protein
MLNDQSLINYNIFFSPNIVEDNVIDAHNITNQLSFYNLRNLRTLSFGNNFNMSIQSNILPNTLHTLSFNDSYNMEINNNVLPNTLHTLMLGSAYNKIIKIGVLPRVCAFLCLAHMITK